MRWLTGMMLVLGVFVLPACHYVSDFKYTPPATSVGKMCVMECLSRRLHCQQTCNIARENCDVNHDENDYYQYMAYHDEQMARHEKETKFMIYKNKTKCQASNQCLCVVNYNICYQDCGGIVLPFSTIE